MPVKGRQIVSQEQVLDFFFKFKGGGTLFQQKKLTKEYSKIKLQTKREQNKIKMGNHILEMHFGSEI